MAKDASVAPKERVNIVYKTSVGDTEEAVELPLKQLVLGHFSDTGQEKRIEDRDSISIDKENFNEVLNAQNVSVDLNVPNKLSEDPEAEMNVSLDFKTMKDFGPEAVAQKVPELQKLMKLREALQALKGPLSNIPEFRNTIQELVSDETQRKQLLKELGLNEE
ncbi:type VI secretion system contractile sheath small subunit [Desulfoluna spongiiphila]|uniref:type VI secretion system contractile sheath small subunit n=1 Tax=Desulfoluna spongiiphila TaxID=419481 RepID=UPI00125BF346|nr:type VI secretion system contractile sheath small subunit [Desulfoluna spongiiphila]VVS91531.1 type vi secretion system vipa vc a0107 or hcp2 [Desulfoluna spongiiphila]